MLAAPNNEQRPLFAANEITKFYLDNSPSIFPSKTGILRSVQSLVGTLTGPKYSGDYLHNVIKQYLGGIRLHQTLTNVVIPTYDINLQEPIIFSTFEAKRNTLNDAFLSDVCIGTSAAPTYLPAYYFETKDLSGNTKSFNLIDGGVAANNPTLLAMTEVTKESLRLNYEWLPPSKAQDTRKFLVLSLGTGYKTASYKATDVAKWGVLEWLSNKSRVPIVETFMQSSSDMVDIHASVVFQGFKSEKNYLRIQEYQLTDEAASVDISTKENLQNLVNFGNNLLKKPVSRVNLETGIFETLPDEGTNKDALIRFAKALSEERRLRLSMSPASLL